MGSRESPESARASPPPPPPNAPGSLLAKNDDIQSPRHKRPRLDPQLVHAVLKYDKMSPNDYVYAMAKEHFYDICNYYEKYSTCVLCHETIEGVPVTFWTCDSCYVCEACACKIYDQNAYEFNKSQHETKYHFVTNIGNDSNLPFTNYLKDIFNDKLKCYICRNSATCRTIWPRTCNLKQYQMGKRFCELLGKREMKGPDDITDANMEQFRSIHHQVTATPLTCPHCNHITFTSHQTNRYLQHILVCTFRKVACVFSDCDVTYRRTNVIGVNIADNNSIEDVFEVVESLDTTNEFIMRHFTNRCRHKVICNLVECKQHPTKDRSVWMCKVSKHMRTFLQSQPVVTSNQFKDRQFKTWRQQEMLERFPETMAQCINPKYAEDTLTTQALEDESDDVEYVLPIRRTRNSD